MWCLGRNAQLKGLWTGMAGVVANKWIYGIISHYSLREAYRSIDLSLCMFDCLDTCVCPGMNKYREGFLRVTYTNNPLYNRTIALPTTKLTSMVRKAFQLTKKVCYGLWNESEETFFLLQYLPKMGWHRKLRKWTGCGCHGSVHLCWFALIIFRLSSKEGIHSNSAALEKIGMEPEAEY